MEEDMFFKKSKEIANDFLQSIVFLDDKAFMSESNNQYDFNAFEVSKAFAKEKKVCGIYNPSSELDIENFKEIAKKSDVVILDWLIKLSNEKLTNTNAEEDADEDDPRGKYTKPIINDLINTNSLKLIIVYTGEDILDDITDRIFEEVKTTLQKKDTCEIYSKNVKILIRFKSNDQNDKQKFKSREHLQDKIVQYNELPSFVLKEFTKMTAGLLSNFALLSLATVRNNSHKILSLFSKDLDAAYMAHKAVLPVQNDAEELLVKLFGDTVTDLLNYASISQYIQNELIDNWIDKNIIEEKFGNNGTYFMRNASLIKKIINESDILQRFQTVTDKQYRKMKITELFLPITEHNKAEEINTTFAKLTHYKSLFLPHNTSPILTLGTVIKSMNNPDNYFVCIQQRCDSVRIEQDSERKFLFLPLSKAENEEFNFITPDGIKLLLDKRSYSIKTIKFKCEDKNREIKGKRSSDNDSYKFKESYDNGDVFEWVFDLKDLHSQRIVTDYASQLSRVGLDESEWLRKAAGNRNKN